jgi:hypothetical protein
MDCWIVAERPMNAKLVDVPGVVHMTPMQAFDQVHASAPRLVIADLGEGYGIPLNAFRDFYPATHVITRADGLPSSSSEEFEPFVRSKLSE